MVATYKFNRVKPPLMKNYNGDIYSVPSEALRELIGTDKWVKQKNVDRNGLRLKGEVEELRFELTRYIYWSLSNPPEHFAEDITKTLTIISGISETQKHNMERSLEVSAGASGFGLSASVKASLKITDETTREWHKEQKDEREQKFKAGFTYCTWILVDEMILNKTSQRMLGGRPSPIDPRLIVTKSEISCITSTYQDKWEDPDSREIEPDELLLQAVPTTAEPVKITLPSGKL